MRRRIARPVALLLVVALAAAASCGAQPAAKAQEVLTGKGIPLTLELKDLGEGWRRLEISPAMEQGDWKQYLRSLLGGSRAQVYYTKGEAVMVDGASYTVAYAVIPTPWSISGVIQALSEGRLPGAEPYTPETGLAVALLDAKTMERAGDPRPFDLQQEVAASRRPLPNPFAVFQLARARARNAASVSNLRQINLGLLIYAQDYDERLPPMKDAESAKSLLSPYVKNEQLFLQPATGRPYQPNPVLAGRLLAEVDEPSETVTFHEPDAAPDQTRGVAFVDGHVTRLSEAEWRPLEEEMAAGAERDALNEVSLAQIRQLGRALRQYAAAHGKALPPMAGVALAAALQPHVEEPGALEALVESRRFRPNPNLSRKKLADLRYPAQTAVFFESEPAEDGLGHPTRAVVFLSGRAKRLPEDEWQSLRARLRIAEAAGD